MNKSQKHCRKYPCGIRFEMIRNKILLSRKKYIAKLMTQAPTSLSDKNNSSAWQEHSL